LQTFNGKNIPVHQFTSDCKGVSELVEPDDRPFFFRAVLQTKLTGEAASVRSIYTITNLEELCEALIKEFGSYKTFEHWDLEMNNLRQNRDESIEKYIAKVRKLNSNMIIAISNYPDQSARAGLKIFATKKLIDHFLGGLHRNVGQQLLAQNFNTLEEAIETAIRYIKKSQYHAERFKTNKPNYLNYVNCDYCKKTGHSESECRTKTFHTQNRNRNQNSQNDSYNRRNSVQNFVSSENRYNNYTQTNRHQTNKDQTYNNYYNSNNPPSYRQNNNTTNNYRQNNNTTNNYRQNNSQHNQNLNYQGQAGSAQRQGHSSGRANPIRLIEPEFEPTQSEQLPETSSPSPSLNSETHQTDSY
jgi:hypothetical protein